MNRQRQIDHFELAAHRLAVQRLRAQPGRTGEVSGQLAHWQFLSGTSGSEVYWSEWKALLAGPLDALTDVVCAETDHATVLRSVLPLSVLITQSERAQLVKQARQAA